MKKILSLIVPMYNEEEVITKFFMRVFPILNGLPVDWEIICINDGSHDGTLELLYEWNRRNNKIRIINLSRNFGKECAVTAGLDFMSGDAVIPIDVDLQDPPEIIPEMVKLWLGGVDIVNAVREERDRDSFLKRTTSRWFYKTINAISDTPILQDVGDYRLLSRRVSDVLRSMHERRRFMKGLFSWVGFSSTSIYYRRESRVAGTTKWNYWKLWNFAIEGITSFSALPIKIATYIGLAIAAASFSYAIILIIDTLMFGNTVKGYPSLMTAMLFLGGMQLMFIGVVGEYISRIHEEVKGRPIYIVESSRGFEDVNHIAKHKYAG